MNEIWRDLVDLLRRRPLLWLPVLVADLLGYALNLGRVDLLKNLVLHRMTQHSALGGAVVQTQLSASQMQSTTAMALLLSWACYFLKLVLFSIAFVVTASLIDQYLHRGGHEAGEREVKLGTSWGGVLELALRSLAVYAVAALAVSWLSSLLARHGYTAVLRNTWFGLALSLIVLLLLSTWLPPVAIRVLTGRLPGKQTTSDAQLLAAVLSVVVVVLSAVVGNNNREMAHVSQAARYPLEMIGSLVVALPYVFLFTGLSLLARRVAPVASESADA